MSYSHDTDGLMAMLADCFKRSTDGEDVRLEVRGGLLCLDDGESHDPHGAGSTFVDLSGPLDEWLPEGWAST